MPASEVAYERIDRCRPAGIQDADVGTAERRHHGLFDALRGVGIADVDRGDRHLHAMARAQVLRDRLQVRFVA